ncbi:MAG: ChbG/HpnK family deacetylase [Anaerolineales bacterium]|nr:ChbG/HpnK family deacetylase [Anaerolineales bacterium]
MEPNPALKKLGLSNSDRVVIFHADDIGMCQGSLSAYDDLIAFGLLSSAATIVPCPWFPAVASYYRNHPEKEKLDIGVHLALTSEWEDFRWGPISTRDPASGLMDENGYFYNNTDDVLRHADVNAVKQELTTQIERALAAGIDITHIDTHMFAIFHSKLLPHYIELGWHYHVPAFIVRWSAEQLVADGQDADEAETLADIIQQTETDGMPLIDYVYMMPLEPLENRFEHARQVLAELPAGISYLLIHPVTDTPELRAMAPDWEARVADRELFINEAWKREVELAGVHVIGWRDLREQMRTGN